LLIASHLRYLIKYLVVFITVVHTYFYYVHILVGKQVNSQILETYVQIKER